MPRGGKREGAGRPATMGRPTDYKPEHAKEAKKLYALGATDLEVADFFEINQATLYRWLVRHSDFSEAAKAGKEALDDRVERSLYHRAVGYSHDAVKVMQFQGQPVIVPYREHVAPDVGAATLWLKNRRKDVWRDKVEHQHTGPNGGPMQTITTAMTAKEAAEAYAGTINGDS